MTINKDELRRLAEAATPGPWHYYAGETDEEAAWSTQFPTVGGPDSEIIGTEGFYSEKSRDEANAEFVAAANPTTILALLDELEAAQKDAGRYRFIKDKQTFIWMIQDWFKPESEFIDADALIDKEKSKCKFCNDTGYVLEGYSTVDICYCAMQEQKP